MSYTKKAAIVCCSNGQSIRNKEKIALLRQTLSELGIDTVLSGHIYADENGFCGTAEERAESLMKFYKDLSVDFIFDISGGDLANELLSLLDYELIAASGKMFWGYSDLTTILNAIYAKTGKPSVLYQVRNLVYQNKEQQVKDFSETVLNGGTALYEFDCSFLQGKEMSGVLAGGNIRCLLKLAGTPYWPDLQGKILLLESYSGDVARITTYLSQLKQMGVFEQVSGVLLGTFTEMERNGYQPGMEELILQYVQKSLPVAVTKEIGHGTDSKAAVIGKNISLRQTKKY